MQKSSDPFENWVEKAHDLPSIEAISALIGAIYDCALDSGLWDATLVDLKQMLRCPECYSGHDRFSQRQHHTDKERRHRPLLAGALPARCGRGRVLAGQLAGETLQQVADALGVARTTARTHLDNIFVKTGVTRQADLMRVAMQIAAIVRP
jgi:hypothetical protein